MIVIKNKQAIETMRQAGTLLAHVFDKIAPLIQHNAVTTDIERTVEDMLNASELNAESRGYHGYQHALCISINDEVVHGMPRAHKIIKEGDLVKIDICASWRGYCADMARTYTVGKTMDQVQQFVQAAQRALDAGIQKAQPGNYLSDISAAIQQTVERHSYNVVRDFAGHGIGKAMHEEPEILNYGRPGRGPILQVGMTLAIEPMITMGNYHVFVADDGWTVKTKDKSLAAHIEDTVLITENGPEIFTRLKGTV